MKRAAEEKAEQYQKWLMEISENMTRMHQNSVPQSIIHTNVSAPSLSKLTTDSTQLIKITPPNRKHQKDRLIPKNQQQQRITRRYRSIKNTMKSVVESQQQ